MFKKIKKELDKKLSAREKALKFKRKALPISQAGVKDIHKNRLKSARKKAKQLEKIVKKMEKTLKNHPDIIDPTIGIVYQEYAELVIYLEFVEKNKLPELNIPEKHYLTGIGDAIGELKRRTMELLSDHKLEDALVLEHRLEELYYEFSSLQYPGSIVPNLKRKQDIARRVLNDLHNQILSYKLQLK